MNGVMFSAGIVGFPAICVEVPCAVIVVPCGMEAMRTSVGPSSGELDDGTLVGGFGTAPFDGEGLPTRRTVIVEGGVLKSYLLNTYMARKLNMASTGNASRGIAGAPGIGAGNLFLESKSPLAATAILADIKSGFYVTELIGQGVNMVTGDYSRGVSGLWIESGELSYPVEGVTIAGNLREMFQNITATGDDLVFRSSVASPTLRIDGMTIAGV